MIVLLTGDACFDTFFSFFSGVFFVLVFWDFVSVAVEGVTGNFAGLADLVDDLPIAKYNFNLKHFQK